MNLSICFISSRRSGLTTFFTTLIFILNLVFTPVYGQYKESEIDFLLEKSAGENQSNNFSKSIHYGTMAYLYSKEIGYTKGIVTSQLELAQAYYHLGRFGDSYRYLDYISENHADYLKKNNAFHLKYTELKGKSYLWQGLKVQAKNEFFNQLKLASNIKNEDTRNLYELKAYALLGIDPEYDSAYYYLRKALSYRSKIKDQSEFILSYSNLSNYYLENQNNIDSAIYYNNMAMELAKKINSRHLFIVLLQKGKITGLQNQPEASLKHSFEALQLVKKNNRGQEMLIAYKMIADMYGELKNYKEQALYLTLYQETKDSLYNDLSNNLFNYLEDLHHDTRRDNRAGTKHLNYLYAIIIILLLILAFTLYKIVKYKKRKTKEVGIIQSKEKEVETLRDQLKNDNSDDLLYIAQHRPSEFPEKFSEIYADFVNKLLEIEPNLVATELTFCAYLRLKFSTKEIASIMHVTPKAIQNRKNRIRKKLNIPSEEDIYVWFNRL